MEEKLVNLEQVCPGVFDIDMQYAKAGRRGAVKQAYVRERVAELLRAAAESLPTGYRLKIWDAWRSYETQLDLYEEYYAKLLADGMSGDDAKEAVLTFVSYPSRDPSKPFLHGTGGAVDVTIVGPDGRDLDMGTLFDCFTEAAYTAAFEKCPGQVRENRRLLLRVMEEQGFTNLESEWWHYDYGDREWAGKKNRQAVYQGILSLYA